LVIAGGVAASGFFVYAGQPTPIIDSSYDEQEVRILSDYATDAEVKSIMADNEVEYIDQLERHVAALDEYITADRMDEYDGFVEWIGGDAVGLLDGMTDMLDSADGLRYSAACWEGDPHGSYYWVWQSGYPDIYICNTATYKFEDSIGVQSHEASHHFSSDGMGTGDLTYSSQDCVAWAEDGDSRAISTASCISSFIQSEPPILISRMQVAGALSAINWLLLDVSR